MEIAKQLSKTNSFRNSHVDLNFLAMRYLNIIASAVKMQITMDYLMYAFNQNTGIVCETVVSGNTEEIRSIFLWRNDAHNSLFFRQCIFRSY